MTISINTLYLTSLSYHLYIKLKLYNCYLKFNNKYYNKTHKYI